MTGEQNCAIAIDQAITEHGSPVSRDTTYTATETTVTLHWRTIPGSWQKFTWREDDAACFEGLYQFDQ